MGKLGKGAIGTSTMDSNTRLCMAAAVYGYMTTFGSDGPPGCYDDIESTNCFFLMGMNPAEMHPQLWRRIANRRRANSSVKLIVVDPRRTQTARSADLHLQLKPGTNVALMNGILQQLIANGWINNAYISSYTRNYAELAAKVASLHAFLCVGHHRTVGCQYTNRRAVDRHLGRGIVHVPAGCVPVHGRHRHGAPDLCDAPHHRQDRPPRLGAVQHYRAGHRDEQPRSRRLVRDWRLTAITITRPRLPT